MKKTHKFDNGIRVFDDQLLDIQRERYERKNVHEEDEEEVFVSQINSLPRGAVYANIGTAIGYYPLLAKKLRSDLKIHCFEPLPRHLEYFYKNIELNGFKEQDFTIHAVAISLKTGKSTFKDNSYGSALSSEKKLKPSLIRCVKDIINTIMGKPVKGKSITVRTLKLSEIFELIQSDNIDFLQMDIQGFEEPVLDAYFSNSIHNGGKIIKFLVGSHGSEIHEKCKKHLENAGYRILHNEPDTDHQPDGILLGSLLEENQL